LNLKYDVLLSSFAFKFNLRRYTQGGVRFSHPFGIAFYLEPLNIGDTAGNASLPGRPALLVTELRSHRLRRIILGGNVSGSPDAALASFAYAGSYNSTRGHLDELGPASMFDAPSAVAVMPETGGGQGLTLVHFSAQPEPFLTQNTP